MSTTPRRSKSGLPNVHRWAAGLALALLQACGSTSSDASGADASTSSDGSTTTDAGACPTTVSATGPCSAEGAACDGPLVCAACGPGLWAEQSAFACFCKSGAWTCEEPEYGACAPAPGTYTDPSCSKPYASDAGADAPSDAAAEDVAVDETTSDTNDADAEDAASIACGTMSCGPTQACVHPCCGGPLPQCLPQSDAGTCPAGSSWGMCFGSGGPTTGCVTMCTPDPPFCAEVPSACLPDPTTTCWSLFPSVCPGGGGIIQGRDVDCFCE